ncbi:hypothetical protein NA56DRAFT_746605 [Hyaloscypha hepaticicola]|uniref:Uncharacterized protein n=1 Tax=Hyaloscypha hepaticicola TaxID=2082293 RepID=A0A2J6QBD5_9HELO|nr:hypothetical protein NA56DRAFT_746605 [Hyaloscypha hepaticicola]
MKVILPNSTRKVNANTTNFDYLREGIMGRPDCSSLRLKDQTLVFPFMSGNGSSRIVCYPERTACIGRHRWKEPRRGYTWSNFCKFRSEPAFLPCQDNTSKDIADKTVIAGRHAAATLFQPLTSNCHHRSRKKANSCYRFRSVKQSEKNSKLEYTRRILEAIQVTHGKDLGCSASMELALVDNKGEQAIVQYNGRPRTMQPYNGTISQHLTLEPCNWSANLERELCGPSRARTSVRNLRPLHTSVDASTQRGTFSKERSFKARTYTTSTITLTSRKQIANQIEFRTLRRPRNTCAPWATETMSLFAHHGPFNEDSRRSPALKFIEEYFSQVDALDFLSIPSSTFYHPSAILHDTKGNPQSSGPRIWQCMERLFCPFDMIHHDLVEARVVPDESGKDVVYAHLLTHFRLRGDTEEIVAPRFFVITVGKAAGIYEGTDGMQIYDVRLFWDTAILARFVTERKKRGV